MGLLERLRRGRLIKESVKTHIVGIGDVWSGEVRETPHPAATEAADTIEALHEALAAITDHYVSLANSGDAGFWDPEKEEPVIRARHALALSKGDAS